MIGPEDILALWFPPGLDADEEAHRRQFQFWFGGGVNALITQRYAGTHEAAARGDLDDWARAPRSRLALIIVLDQFSRSLHGGSGKAYAQDHKAVALAIDGVERGFYDQLATVWEKTFFVLPLGHSEQLAHLDQCISLAEALVDEAPAHLRSFYEFSASQARGHREVIARFGRQPHRNAFLGRNSTAEERAYLEAGEFVHLRSFDRWRDGQSPS
jgi:uncharacterized protein (DUF924 family)